MSSIKNKRQQARNERMLQDLIKSVPGNDRCADCGTRNPAWASWSLGIFLCIRCASLHRKLGTHISKIKSVSMDMWTNDQIDNMRSRGNVISNTIHNPDASKHPVPLNGEDSDSLMERYIRNKYEHKLFMRETAQPQNSSTSSISSGASSSTSAPPTRSVSAGYVASRNPPARAASPSSSSSSKVSQVLGLGSIPYTDARQGPPAGSVVFPHGMVAAPPYQDQLQSLKDMGFKDDRKIMEVLKSVNGKIIEASEILLLLRNDSSSDNLPATAGISVQKSGGSANPFDALDRELPPLPPGATEVGGIKPQSVPSQVAPQQQQVSVGYQNSYQTQGPTPAAIYGGGDQWFDTQQPQGQQQAGGNATYGQQMQGQAYQGFAQQPQQPIQAPQTNPYSSLTTSAMFAPTPVTAGSVNTNGGIGGYNPFFSNSAPPMQKPYNPLMQPPALQQNPYLQQQQQQAQQQQQLLLQQEQLRQQQLQQQRGQQQEQLRQLQLQQQQAQQQTQQQQAQQEQLRQLQLQRQQAQQQTQQQTQQQAQFQQQQALYNPQQQWPTTAAPSYSQQPQMNPYQSNLQAQQPLMPQRAGIDKSSILALYNYPQLAPPPNNNPVNQQQQESQAPVSNVPPNLATRFANGVATSAPVAPGAGSNNPFLPPAPPAGGVGGGRGHMSQESMDFGAWQSGRHSPDAFASLSFRQ